MFIEVKRERNIKILQQNMCALFEAMRVNGSQRRSTLVNDGQQRSAECQRNAAEGARDQRRSPPQEASNLVLFHEMKAGYRGERRRRRWGGYYHIIRMPERRVREDSDALEPT